MSDQEIYSLIEKIQTDLEIVKREIGSNLTSQETIKMMVCEYFNITKDDLESKSRKRDTSVIPRQFFYLFSRALLNVSLKRLGIEAGNKCHATALSGISTICGILNSGDRTAMFQFEGILKAAEQLGYDSMTVRKFVRATK